ncbi:Fc.00g015270.m01.CDS01 [Cosmosporella sp. VM-42]
MEGNFVEFVQRFQTLTRQQEVGNKLIEDLLIYVQGVENRLRQENQRLADSVRDLQLDLSDATSSRRDLQQRLQKAETRIAFTAEECDNLKNRNPYVLLLIDGDGLIFQDHWIKQGLEGGKKAAYALRSAVAEQCGERAFEIEFIAKVFANVTGLGRAMMRDGCLNDLQNLRDFTLGFTQAKASFDFIDVGYGKERADAKIRETTRWNLRNQNCKHILLGISHDAGYAPFLDEVLQDEKTRQQISVIEGISTVRELRATNTNVLKLGGDLFRNDKLVDRDLFRNDKPAPFPPPLPVSVPPVQTTTAVSTPATSNASVSPTPGGSTSSYANVMASASPPPQLTLPLAPKPNPPVRSRTAPLAPTWKPGPRGVDGPISVSQQAVESIKKRKDSNKLCNNHYLRGPCAKGDTCCFVHNYKPTNDEINAIALLSRLNPCTSGQDCDVNDCIYGHHCPSVKDGVCGHPYCKFAVEAHPPGTKFKNPNIRDN